MKILLLKKGFKSYSDSKFLELARNVLLKVNRLQVADTNNSEGIHIPNLTPTNAEVETIIDAFENAIIAYMNKGKVEKIRRDLRRAELENVLKLWAMQIEVFANGDIEILIESGFDLNKEPTPNPHPGVPVGFKVISTNSGELTLSAKKIKGVVAFIFELKEVDTTDVIVCTQGNNKCIQRGLKSGTCYECRVAYVAKDDLKVYSEMVRCWVQ